MTEYDILNNKINAIVRKLECLVTNCCPGKCNSCDPEPEQCCQLITANTDEPDASNGAMLVEEDTMTIAAYESHLKFVPINNADISNGVVLQLSDDILNDLGWKLNGNTDTDSTINFIGTKDNQNITFKVNNTKVAEFDKNNGALIIGDTFNYPDGVKAIHKLMVSGKTQLSTNSIESLNDHSVKILDASIGKLEGRAALQILQNTQYNDVKNKVPILIAYNTETLIPKRGIAVMNSGQTLLGEVSLTPEPKDIVEIKSWLPGDSGLTLSGLAGLMPFLDGGRTIGVDNTGKVGLVDTSGSANDNAWRTIGNAGTNSSNNFIGTTDNQDLSIRINNSKVANISSEGIIQLSNIFTSPNITPLGKYNTYFENAPIVHASYRMKYDVAGVQNISTFRICTALSNTDYHKQAKVGDAILLKSGNGDNLVIGGASSGLVAGQSKRIVITPLNTSMSNNGGIVAKGIENDITYVGIGTYDPTATLEINSNINNTSGMKFTKLNSSSPSTLGAKALGVDASGNVVTVDSGGSGTIPNLQQVTDVGNITTNWFGSRAIPTDADNQAIVTPQGFLTATKSVTRTTSINISGESIIVNSQENAQPITRSSVLGAGVFSVGGFEPVESEDNFFIEINPQLALNQRVKVGGTDRTKKAFKDWLGTPDLQEVLDTGYFAVGDNARYTLTNTLGTLHVLPYRMDITMLDSSTRFSSGLSMNYSFQAGSEVNRNTKLNPDEFTIEDNDAHLITRINSANGLSTGVNSIALGGLNCTVKQDGISFTRYSVGGTATTLFQITFAIDGTMTVTGTTQAKDAFKTFLGI